VYFQTVLLTLALPLFEYLITETPGKANLQINQTEILKQNMAKPISECFSLPFEDY
jgi:hypothetical protein